MSEQEQTPDTPEISPIEVKAREMGWRGKDEWQGDEEDFIDAKEFVRRKPLFDKIDELSRSVKNVKAGYDALIEHNGKLKDAEFKRAVDYLKNSRRQALIDGETEDALKYEDQIAEVEKTQQAYVQEQETLKSHTNGQDQIQEAQRAFASWRDKNPWYKTDEAMTVFADSLGKKYVSEGMSPEEVLKKIGVQIRNEFPHKFKNPMRDKPGAVENSQKAAKGGDSVESSMTEAEKRIMNTILRSTSKLTKAQYLEQYKAIKGA